MIKNFFKKGIYKKAVSLILVAIMAFGLMTGEIFAPLRASADSGNSMVFTNSSGDRVYGGSYRLLNLDTGKEALFKVHTQPGFAEGNWMITGWTTIGSGTVVTPGHAFNSVNYSQMYLQEDNDNNITIPFGNYRLIVVTSPTGGYKSVIDFNYNSYFGSTVVFSMSEPLPLPTSCIITYNLNGGFGADPDAQTVSKGQTLTSAGKTLPATPTWPGHAFRGWFTAEIGGTPFTATTVINGAMTIYAQWEDNESIDITYKSNGGTGNDIVDPILSGGNYGILLIGETGYTRSGYTFKGWSTTAGGSADPSYAPGANTNPTTALTLYAVWEKDGGGGSDDTTTYTLTYKANGGVGDDYVVTGKAFTVATVATAKMTREGYTFKGWNKAADGTETLYNAGSSLTVTADITLFAQWEEETGDLPTDLLNKDDHIAYLTGYPGGSVGADKGITRAEAASIFYRLLLDPPTVTTGTFSDVASGAWYAQSVNCLASMGILSGYPGGTFKPDAPITRAEFATIASKFEELATSSKTFGDVPSGHWAAAYINSVYAKGWVSGYPDGTFRPENSITRAEVVQIVNAVLERSIDSEALAVIENPFNDITSGHWAYAGIIEASVAHEYTKDDDGEEIWTLEE